MQDKCCKVEWSLRIRLLLRMGIYKTEDARGKGKGGEHFLNMVKIGVLKSQSLEPFKWACK